MQTIRILTNDVAGGWSPYDLETFLGGSEECVVLLAESFVQNGFEVVVYHSRKESETDGDINKNGVVYKDRDFAICCSDDIFISFKTTQPWLEGAEAKVKIHWSSDVEIPWDTSNVDRFVNLTEFHQLRNLFVDPVKSVVIPHGIDIESLEKNKVEKTSDNIVLYCSSPDRGLHQLLNDWASIKHSFKNLKLRIAYGFEMFDKIMGEHGEHTKRSIMGLCRQSGIEWLGQLTKDQIEKEYWGANYWIMPLQKPESELFCLNALKTRYCGNTPVVNRIGALRNTVGSHIPYNKFYDGSTAVEENEDFKIETWDEIVKGYWIPLFETIEKEKEGN